MLHLFGPASRRANTLSRREMLRIGGLGMTGISLPMLLDRPASAATVGAKRDETPATSKTASTAKRSPPQAPAVKLRSKRRGS